MNREAQPKERSLFKAVGLVSLMTLSSRILGLLREMTKAALLGTSFYSDAFTLAFTFPNLFRRLTAEGAMNGAFIPVFSKLLHEEGEERAFHFARSFFWLFTAALLLFSLLFILFAPWLIRYVFAAGFSGKTLTLTVVLTQAMFVYIVFISLAAVLQGLLNSFAVFWLSSLTPALLNVAIISCAVLLAPRLSNPTWGFAAGVLLGGVIQLGIQIPHARRLGLRFLKGVTLSDPGIRRVFVLMLPTLFGTGIYQVNIIISNLIASTLAEGSIAALSFSNRLLELIIGVFIVSMTTVYLPHFSSLVNSGRLERLAVELRHLAELAAFITLPATIGVFLIAGDLVNVLFARGRFDETSILMTAGALRYHILGLAFIAWNRILLSVFQAGQWLRQTVHVAAIVLVINAITSLLLSRTAGHLGIAAANTISQIVQTVLLVFYLHGHLKQSSGLLFPPIRFLKTITISALLLVILWGFQYLLLPFGLPAVLRVLSTIAFGVGCYTGLAILFKSRELKSLIMLGKSRNTIDGYRK